MSFQECALYGELVRHLRDKCVERITELDAAHDAEAARAWADKIIRDWLLTPNQDTLGSSPAEIIWRERKGEPNIVPPEHEHEMFFDDCPACQAMKELELGGEWHWTYDSGGFPLLEEYDTEGADLFYGDDDMTMAEQADDNDFVARRIPLATPEQFVETLKRLTDEGEYDELFGLDDKEAEDDEHEN